MSTIDGRFIAEIFRNQSVNVEIYGRLADELQKHGPINPRQASKILCAASKAYAYENNQGAEAVPDLQFQAIYSLIFVSRDYALQAIKYYRRNH